MSTFIIGVLATWRVASLLFTEGGPFHLFDRFRALFWVGKDAAGDTQCFAPVEQGFRYQVCHMLECFWCTSVWSAFAVGVLMQHFVLVDMLAWSAGAIFLGFISVLAQQAMSSARFKPRVMEGHQNGTQPHAQEAPEGVGGKTTGSRSL